MNRNYLNSAPPWLIIVLLIVLWPVGLLLLWKNADLDKSRKKKWTYVWLGCWVAFFVIYTPFILAARSRYAANMEKAEALWSQDKQAEATELYYDGLEYCPEKEKPLVYGRLIDFEASQGNQTQVDWILEHRKEWSTGSVFESDPPPRCYTPEGRAVVQALSGSKPEPKIEPEPKTEPVSNKTQAQVSTGEVSLKNGPVPIDNFFKEHRWADRTTPPEGKDIEGTPVEYLKEYMRRFDPPYRYHFRKGHLRYSKGRNESVDIGLLQAGEDKTFVGMLIEAEYDYDDPPLRPFATTIKELLPGFDLISLLKEDSAKAKLLSGGLLQEYGQVTVLTMVMNGKISALIWFP